MTRNNLFVYNEKLLETWKQYREAPSEENERAFFEELTTAQFLVPVKRKSEDGNQRGGTSRFLLIVTKEQENFLPAFTDALQWEKWPFQKEETAVVTYDLLKKIITDDPQRLTGISINPFGENLTLNQEALARIDVLLAKNPTRLS